MNGRKLEEISDMSSDESQDSSWTPDVSGDSDVSDVRGVSDVSDASDVSEVSDASDDFDGSDISVVSAFSDSSESSGSAKSGESDESGESSESGDQDMSDASDEVLVVREKKKKRRPPQRSWYSGGKRKKKPREQDGNNKHPQSSSQTGNQKSKSSKRVDVAIRTPRKFKCYHCVERFATGAELSAHTQDSHRNLFQNCKICGSFIPKAMLNPHNRTMHSDVLKYECDKCGRRFRHAIALSAHGRAHNTRVCGFCDMHCAGGDQYRQHITYHETHVCKLCGLKRSKDTVFLKHMNTAHFITLAHEPEKLYQCEICKKILVSLKFMDSHLEAEHSETADPEITRTLNECWKLHRKQKRENNPEELSGDGSNSDSSSEEYEGYVGPSRLEDLRRRRKKMEKDRRYQLKFERKYARSISDPAMLHHPALMSSSNIPSQSSSETVRAKIVAKSELPPGLEPKVVLEAPRLNSEAPRLNSEAPRLDSDAKNLKLETPKLSIMAGVVSQQQIHRMGDADSDVELLEQFPSRQMSHSSRNNEIVGGNTSNSSSSSKKRKYPITWKKFKPNPRTQKKEKSPRRVKKEKSSLKLNKEKSPKRINVINLSD